MSAYGFGILTDVTVGPGIVEYLERIDATLAPYGGHFIVHGGEPEMLEGFNPGAVIVIEFADADRARAWYESAEYQEILALRTDNAESTVFIIDGVGPEHRATDVLAAS